MPSDVPKQNYDDLPFINNNSPYYSDIQEAYYKYNVKYNEYYESKQEKEANQLLKTSLKSISKLFIKENKYLWKLIKKETSKNERKYILRK